MTSTVLDEAASTRSWGGSLAMAGAMAAGLAAGRSSTLALAAGVVAAAGLKRMMRRNPIERIGPAGPRAPLSASAPGGSPEGESGCCCSGEERTPPPAACDAVRTEADAPSPGLAQQADFSGPAEGTLAIWEQGRDETVSRGAVGTQTVWFGMHEPAEVVPAGLSPDQFRIGAIPAVPLLAKTNEPAASAFCEAPDGNLASLPAVPAIAEGSGVPEATASSGFPPTGGGAGGRPRVNPQPVSNGSANIPALGVWNPADEKAIPGGPLLGAHRSVVPHAPVEDRRKGRWMMLVTTVVLVIVALAVVRGALQQNGWKFPWQVARGEVKEQRLKEAGVWTAPLPGKSEGAFRSDADGMIR